MENVANRMKCVPLGHFFRQKKDIVDCQIRLYHENDTLLFPILSFFRRVDCQCNTLWKQITSPPKLCQCLNWYRSDTDPQTPGPLSFENIPWFGPKLGALDNQGGPMEPNFFLRNFFHTKIFGSGWLSSVLAKYLMCSYAVPFAVLVHGMTFLGLQTGMENM